MIIIIMCTEYILSPAIISSIHQLSKLQHVPLFPKHISFYIDWLPSKQPQASIDFTTISQGSVYTSPRFIIMFQNDVFR